MIDKKINERQKLILFMIEPERFYSITEIAKFFIDKNNSSIPTLRRDISDLSIFGYLEQSGKLKSTRYQITTLGLLLNPIDPEIYCNKDPDKRNGLSTFNFSLFYSFPKNVFSVEEVLKLETETKKFIDKSEGVSTTIERKELERFVIELSWKSSKIEGNTYSLLDTELLLNKGIEAPGHSKDEATMILNHKEAFQYLLSSKDLYLKPNVRLIEDIHRLLVQGLNVSFGLRSRQVGVTGSKYIPLSIPSQISEALGNLCDAINQSENPYQKALLALVGISYIQPFEDGNKRTARLFANAILLAYQLAPLSYRNVDERHYRESILVFYEKNSIVPMQNIFIEQYLFACANYLRF